MNLPAATPETPASPLASLNARAAALQAQLHALQTLPGAEQPEPDTLLKQLRRYWNAADTPGTSRRQALIEALQQELRDEIDLKNADGSLHPGYHDCLSSDTERPASHQLYLAAEDNPGQLLHGALVWLRADGASLLYLPGHGLEGFASEALLRQTLAHWLNDPALRSRLLHSAPCEYQAQFWQMAADPDLDARPFGEHDLLLVPLAGDAWHSAVEDLLDKQRQDVAWVCSRQPGNATERAAWQLQLQAALGLHGLLGPGPMLRRRSQEQALRREALQAPQWLRDATPEQRQRYLDALLAYEHARIRLDSLMQGCASASSFARTRLAACIHNDLGYDLDPDRVIATTRRRSPLGDIAYQTRRTLSELALYGLHDGDQDEHSCFHRATTLSLDEQPLHSACPLLTPAWLASAIERLALRARFGEAQRAIYGTAQVKTAMDEVLRHKLQVQTLSALYQGHIRPEDARLSEALAGQPGNVRVVLHQLRLNSAQTLADMLLITLQDHEGATQRLLLWTPESPDGQALRAFDHQRQLLHALVAWSASPEQCAYLLEQTQPQQRAALQRALLALREKPQPAQDFLGFIEHTGFADAFYAMSTAHIRIRLAEQNLHTPEWLLRASLAERQQLLACEEAIAGLSQGYAGLAHAQVPEYETFVHQLARRRINALLELPDGTVDPDHIIVRSPRETLSYTRMLRDGYDDSLGLFNASADTQASFSGPPGVDLSPLTPEKVAGSVRGAWPSDAWVAHLRTTQLDPASQGYDERRRLSLSITQLQMRHAALLALLKGQIAAGQYAWLNDSIARMDDATTASRQRYPVYPLQWVIDNPLIASELSALGEVANVLDIPVAQRETALGCFILCPPGSRRPEHALLYTPGAPDGLAWRPLARFQESLQAAGMSDYYKDRCRLAMNRTLAFWFIDLKKRSDAAPPAIPASPLMNLHEACFDQVLLRKIRDVQDRTSGRSELIARLAWNSLELVAMAVTLPFPPASFAVGALLTLRDSARALQALADGDREAASLHLLGAWLNALGAAGDASAGLKGLGGLLRPMSEQGGHNPVMKSLRQAQAASVARLEAAASAVPGPTPVWQAAQYDSQKLLLAGQAQRTPALAGPGPAAPHGYLAHATQRSLDGGEAMAAGHAKGVTRIEGRYYITFDEQVYEVQYDARLRLWQIIDPANPFAFYGKQPVRLDDSGQWRVLDARRLRGGGDTPFQVLQDEPLSSATQAAQTTTGHYELPAHWKPQLMGITTRDWIPAVDFGLALPVEFFAPLLREGREAYAALRETLRRDATAFFEQVSLAAKPDLPPVSDSMTADDLLKAVFHRHSGLVVSETLQSVSSKQLLIDNMARLAEQNVEIIYLEHLFTDLHLDKLRKYHKLGNSTRTGSAEIKSHLESLNKGALINGLDHKYDYYHLIKTAHRHGIEVRPLSSSVSYDFLDSTAPVPTDDPAAMQKMSVFFASRVIASDTGQAPARRWVALVEQQHANTHLEVPGLAELHGAVSVRVEDVAGNQPLRVLRDLPGAVPEAPVSRGDFLLQMPSPRIKAPVTASPATSATATPEKLDFALAQLLRRQEHRAQAQQATPALSRTLLDHPGRHGFELDAAGHWQRASAADWPAALEPTALQRSLADPLYQMPGEHLDAAHELAFFEHRGLHPLYSLESDTLRPTRRLFFQRRARLQEDARALGQAQLPARPVLPDITPSNTQQELIDSLYERTSGLVIGEYHSSIASKQFIIDNLPHLARREVKTLYLEHLQADMHQLDLDLFFDKGLMTKRLLHYLKYTDRGFFTDPAGQYGFEQLVIQARAHGIEVRALDCMASYYLRHMANATRSDRQAMLNFFASRAIRRHQELLGAHRWIALVGETHANRFEAGIPGLAELEQGISLRVYDTPVGEGFGPAPDPGRVAGDALGAHRALVRNDFALGLPTRHGPVSLADELLADSQAASAESRLYRPGLFMLENHDGGLPVIVHRSRRNQIERTPVQRSRDGRLYVDRQRWRRIHLHPFEDLSALVKALERMHLSQVS